MPLDPKRRTPKEQAAYVQGWAAGVRWMADRAATEIGNAAVHIETAARDQIAALQAAASPADHNP